MIILQIPLRRPPDSQLFGRLSMFTRFIYCTRVVRDEFLFGIDSRLIASVLASDSVILVGRFLSLRGRCVLMDSCS